MTPTSLFLALSLLVAISADAQSERQLANWLKRFPKADLNGDGKLTVEEASKFRKQFQRDRRPGGGRGVVRNFKVDEGWKKDRFPEHAVSYKSPEEIKAIYAKKVGEERAVRSFDKPTDGAIRVVGTGHSFMAPGYKTLPLIAKAAGMEQPLYTHTGGGMTGSTRYKWEQENGIFQFDGRPTPKLLASISNAKWEAMMWGPYFNDKPEYYTCWVEFCLKYNPDMKFYLSDAWPQLHQLKEIPKSEEFFTEEVMDRLGRERSAEYTKLIELLNGKYGERVFIMPTSDAMVLAAKHYLRGELPGIEGLHKSVGKKERSLWRDTLGHLGPGFDQLEGYVFYATLYGRSPELIREPVAFREKGDFPGPELDRIFRKIAWQAVSNNPLSGVKDSDMDGVGD
ncbi:MAG: hypothetical protein CMO80_10745 [Verrucomicrobiales bacterium]|nr:hypothetical protein [Verrucomicrobiales bacterium]|tara:strand:- start:17105 stop:18292 length:1188 start_codon:yes stop_codon:yes gene_type:complete